MLKKEDEKKKEEAKLKKEDEAKRKVEMKQRAREEEERRWAELDAEKQKEPSEELTLEDEYIDEFYCEVCMKAFKSEASLLNHNNSNGHKKAIKQLLKEVGLPHEKQLLE